MEYKDRLNKGGCRDYEGEPTTTSWRGGRRLRRLAIQDWGQEDEKKKDRHALSLSARISHST